MKDDTKYTCLIAIILPIYWIAIGFTYAVQYVGTVPDIANIHFIKQSPILDIVLVTNRVYMRVHDHSVVWKCAPRLFGVLRNRYKQNLSTRINTC